MNKYVITAIESLRNNQEIFCSEKHLQMCFCQEIIEKHRNYQCIPEYPIKGRKSRKHIDLIIIDNKGKKQRLNLNILHVNIARDIKV